MATDNEVLWVVIRLNPTTSKERYFVFRTRSDARKFIKKSGKSKTDYWYSTNRAKWGEVA